MRDSAPPFRVLEKCQELCLRDRTATNNLVRICTSFDFQPGSRIASFSGAAEYEESTCYLTREQAQPEGIGNLMLMPNSVHFTEVCLGCEFLPNSKTPFVQEFTKNIDIPLTFESFKDNVSDVSLTISPAKIRTFVPSPCPSKQLSE